MNEIKVNSTSELFDKLLSFKNSRAWIFRGHQDAAWKLLPKAGRPEFVNSYSRTINEKSIFESWKRYALHFLEKVPQNDLDWLTLAQHHGLATRLLDWTKTPLNAVFFAVNNNEELEAAVYCLEIRTSEILPESVVDPFGVEGIKVFFPKGMSARILSQRGLFIINDEPEVPLDDKIGKRLHKIIIDRMALKEINDTLEFLGVNELSIFQDLNSLSDHLNGYVIKGKGTGARAITIGDAIPPFG